MFLKLMKEKYPEFYAVKMFGESLKENPSKFDEIYS